MKNPENSQGVIVIGDHVQALGIIRSLGRRGIPVYLLHDKNLCIGRFSRYTKRYIKTPSASNETAFIDFMINLAKNEQIRDWILMPTNDAWVYVLSKHKETLEDYYKVPTPSWDIVKFAYDKKLTYSIAEKNDILIPKTIYPKNIDDVYERLKDIRFPVIIKGVIGHKFYQKTGVKVLKVESQDELLQQYKKYSSNIDPSETVVQEVIRGNSTFSFCSFRNNKLIGYWIGLKIREHPMGFGTGSFAQSVKIPELFEIVERFLNAINYYGISELEFKKDPRDGKYKLIEMNARTWLWHSLAIRCGVDFPYLLYKDMIGEDVTPVMSFREGIKWIHIYTDLWVAMKEILKRNLKIGDYLRSLKGEKEFGVFSLEDPLPFLCETIMLPYLWKTRVDV
jgi:predicted ATP-grasp superfamily ATP-dependent carboligase